MPQPRFPTPEEIGAFVREYEDARGASMPPALAVAMVQTLTYGARCEHSTQDADTEWRDLLRAIGPPLLRHGLRALR